MQVYVTKYATTRGIVEFEGESLDGIYFRAKTHGASFPNVNWPRVFMRNEWYEHKQDAVKDALRRITKERDNLQLKLRKLDTIENDINA